MTGLVVQREDGSVMFDTSKISYGLVKSGYLTDVGAVNRLVCTTRACRADPSWGGNWTETGSYNDHVFSFTVKGSKAPIVFLSGSGVFIGTEDSGDVKTFKYMDATTNTKFFCFDLMDDIGSGPALRSYTDQRVLTFNSRQPPLNVIQVVQATGRGAAVNSRVAGWYHTVYAGGYSERFNIYNLSGYNFYGSARSSLDIALPGLGECAAFIPWSRGITAAFRTDANGSGSFSAIGAGLTEGCFGTATGVRFTCTVGRTSTGEYQPTEVPADVCFRDIPVDRLPTALVIQTVNLPFPFEIPR